MKRKWIFLLIGVVTFTAACFVLYEFCPEIRNLLRKSADCDVYIYNYKFGAVDEDSKNLCYQYNYDVDGNIVEYYILSDEKVAQRIVYSFTNGKIVESIEYSNKNKIIEKTTYKYDDNGKLIESIAFSSEGSIKNKNKFIYDTNGYLINERTLNSEGKTVSLIKYYNDSKGIPQSKINEKSNEQFSYKYDSNGKLIEEICCNVRIEEDDYTNFPIIIIRNDTTYFSRHIYVYDSKGNKTEESEFDIKNKRVDRITHCYDNLGRVIESVSYDKLNEPFEKLVYEYRD